MRFLTQRKNLWLLLATILGALMLYGGHSLSTWKSTQVDSYNQGIRAYENGDMQEAVRFFDQSISAYKSGQRAHWLKRFIYPQPSRELAAKAYFQKGKAHLQAGKGQLAVEAFKESLRLNPGNQMENLSGAEIKRLQEDARVVQYDLEMLFKSRPDLAKQQGKGKGKGEGKDKGKQQVPGQEPGSQPGKGNKDDI